MKENIKEDIPCVLYLNIHSKLRKLALEKYKSPRMPISEMEWRMFAWKVPSTLRYIVLREMIMLNLIKKISQYEIELLESDFDENDLRKIYKKIGFEFVTK